MTREILFKGKRVDNGEWAEGWLYHDQKFINGTPCVDVFIIRDECDDDYFVKEETVGQYTGLNDKNGVKIFEGDIVKTNKGVGYIEFYRSNYIVKGESEWQPNLYYAQSQNNLVVIGNIHDNKMEVE